MLHCVIAIYAATVVLNSSVACPGESDLSCTVNQGFFLDWIVEPFLPTSARIQFMSTDSIGSRLDCNSVASVQCVDFNFVATLTNTANPNVVSGTTLADMTSTLTFPATAGLNGTVVQCRGSTATEFPTVSRTLNVTGMLVFACDCMIFSCKTLHADMKQMSACIL